MATKGRPKKGQAVNEKIDRYLSEYDLDDMNETNDMASIHQMCELEITIEKLQSALNKIKKLEDDPKKAKDLMTSIKDATATWVKLQTELGISKRKRDSASDESVLSYVEKLKTQAKKFMDSRLKVVICEDCSLPVGKYHVYIKEHGEPGALAYENVDLAPIKYTFRVECPRCGNIIVDSNEE